MNYKIFLIPLVLTLMLFTFGLVKAESTGISDYAYLTEIGTPTFLPTTISAGDIVSLAINIRNKGSIVPIENLNVTLNIGDQFEGIDLNQTISNILPSGTKTAIFKFKVKEDVVAGYYPATLELNYIRSGDLVSEKSQLTITVSNVDKRLDLSITPTTINPGNETLMTFSLQNLTGANVSNVSLTWEESTGLILPLGSDNKKNISLIESNKTGTITTNIASDPNITPGIYLIDINISYTGINGTQIQESKIGLIVGGKTDFEISAEMQSSGLLSLSIANIGSNNAGAVVIKIPKQPGVNVNGTNTAILGNIDIGDFTLANFQVKSAMDINSTIANPQTNATNKKPDMNTSAFSKTNRPNSIVLEIDYTDTTGTRQITQKTIQLSLAATIVNPLAARSTSSSSTIPIIILIIILGLGVIYNKYKAKKEWKSFCYYSIAIIVLFLIAIYLFSSSTTSIIILSILSILLYGWYFFKSKGK
jgi:hypothetical protein